MAEDILVSTGLFNDISNYIVDTTALLGPNILGAASVGIVGILGTKFYLIFTEWRAEMKSLDAKIRELEGAGFGIREDADGMQTGLDQQQEEEIPGKLVQEEAEAREELSQIRFENQRTQARITIAKADIEKIEEENESAEEQLDERKNELLRLQAERAAVDKKLTEMAGQVGLKNMKKEMAHANVEKHLDKIEVGLQQQANYQERVLMQMEKTNASLTGSVARLKVEQQTVEQEITQIRNNLDATDLDNQYLKEHPSAENVRSRNTHNTLSSSMPLDSSPLSSAASTRF